MGKKEKNADLEQLLSKLLNDLLRMGWKPFNRDKTLHIDCYDKCKGLNYKWIHLDGGFMNEESRTLRELVSIESGLWQFVCENGMIKPIGSEIEIKNLNEGYGVIRDTDYQYRVIVSSLKDDSELESFILDNIKVEGKNMLCDQSCLLFL